MTNDRGPGSREKEFSAARFFRGESVPDIIIIISILLMVLLVPLRQVPRYVLTFVVLAAWAWKVLVRRERAWHPSPVYRWLMFLTAAACVSGIVNFATGGKLFREVWRIFEFAVFFFLGFHFIRDDRRRELFGWTVAIAAVVTALCAVLQYFVSAYVLLPAGNFVDFRGQSARADAFYFNPDIMGIALVLLSPVVFGLVAGKDRYGDRRVLLLCVLLLGGVLVSGSYGSVFGLAAAVFVFVLGSAAEGRRGGTAIRTVWGVIGVLIGMIAGMIFVVGVRPNSFLSRFHMWETAFQIWRDHPLFGIGVRNFGEYYSLYAPDGYAGRAFSQTHNLFLQVLCEQGIAGFLLFLAVLVVLFREGLRSLRRAPGPFAAYLGLGCCAACIGGLANGMTVYLFAPQEFAFLFWLFGGVMCAVAVGKPDPGCAT